VGNNGETLVADSSATTGLRWQGDYAAGKNKFINGDFGIWQRGTSFTLTNNVQIYAADRFVYGCTFSAGSASVSRQTFTPGTAPVAGYEGQFFSRLTCGSTSTVWWQRQLIEDVRTFAGQTVTLSFWVKASAAASATAVQLFQNFGSGGSTGVATDATGPSITTSWQRFSVTMTLPSISGKTIGTSNFLEVSLYAVSGIASSISIDTWGWQLEVGSVATAFQTATGTIQGELAACQRYYFRQTGGSPAAPLAAGYADSTTRGVFPMRMPVTMRIEPNAIEFSSVGINFYGLGQIAVTSLTLDGTHAGPDCVLLIAAVASGLTQYRPYDIVTGSSGYVGLSAEL
jgi:hypothetical protein